MSVILYKYLESLQMWKWSGKGKCDRRPILLKSSREIWHGVYLSVLLLLTKTIAKIQ